MNEVAKSIKNLRKEKKLTQDQLAEQLHVTRQAVSNWENGKTQPDIDTLKQIAEFFDVSIERIIYGKEKKRFYFSVKADPQAAIELGSILAMILSYDMWGSIGKAILHGILGWAYVIYYVIKF